jgi:outer membrane protein OmpA-like peptidoglycan-associated protein
MKPTSHSARTTRRLFLAACCLAAGLAYGIPAAADEMKVFTDRPPTSEEVSNILFPELNKMGQGKTRGIDRGIVFTNKDPKGQDPQQAEAPAREFGMAVEFAYDSARILDDAAPYLDSLGNVLAGNRAIEFAIYVVGHTDAQGTDEYNLTLSQRRADAVKDYLVRVHGVDPERLITVGKGETELLDPADPASAANRRVEFRRIQ